MSESQARLLFQISAIFNGIACLILFAPFGIAGQLGVRPIPAGGPFELIAVSAIALFGLAYFWVSKNPYGNLQLVKLGLIGKIAVVAIVYYSAFVGTASLEFAALASGDIVFSGLFIWFLVDAKKRV
ncbi:hypothetical protein [Zhongshania arctica]|uniref:Uncharacterized protein n=1 Tax=Zhongshania arctica TaxID=3238302 RepID=A0ABV3TVJ9_9GAMM